MRLTWCHSRLAIGSFSQEADAAGSCLDILDCLTDLERVGVTHIINCRRDAASVRSLQVVRGIALLWNPTEDDGQPKPPEWFGKSIDFALSALASPRHKVAVICYHGNNRSPSTALAILIAQGLHEPCAEKLVLQARPGAQIRYAADALRAVEQLGYC